VGAPGRALSRAHEELIGAAPRVGARPPVARRWGAAPRRGDNSEATAAAVGASSAGFGVIAGQGTYRWAGGGGCEDALRATLSAGGLSHATAGG